MTRAPLLDEAENAEACPVRNLLNCFKAARLSVQPGCTKIEGDPECCKVCPPAFPSIHKHKGVRCHAMPKAKVTEITKKLFLSLAELDLMTEEEANTFSGKSARTGGVSEAAANCVRSGVVQEHGGWLMRESLVHYDQIRKGERRDVSRALNAAVAKLRTRGD